MIRLFTSIFKFSGKIFGGIVCPVYFPKVGYGIYLFQREYTTQLHKRRFRTFGVNSLLAPSITLINPKFISIGAYSSIMRGCVLETCPCSQTPEIRIGNHVSLGEYSHITAAANVRIGNGVLTGRYVLITDNAHGASQRDVLETPPLLRSVVTKGPVIIEDNVWIGDKATILSNVHIGRGAVIGANAVVTKDVPAYAVVGGNPAGILKQL